MTLAPSVGALPRQARHDHIVDVLIAERAPKLSSGRAWPLVRPLLYALLDYGKARRMAEAIAPLPGRAALDLVSRRLDLKLTVEGIDRVPPQGRLVVVANHPTGLADGLAVYDALKDRRPDLCFYANADAHRVVPRFDEVLIPVEWVEAKRTRERTRLTLQLTRQVLEAGRALVIFPAGRLARRAPGGGLADPPWAPSAISIARKYAAPILPVRLTGPASRLFHAFDRVSGELRDITLFHEMLNKRGRAFTLTIGPPIAPDALPADPAEAVARLKAHVEQALAADPDRAFA
ncbi:1-acyl-sn-glycerol-3-phosphate acyltransferase [Phenylobacterium sp.]|jgi:putative hemolysin|uniref:1-acyl-sn-glycerol-3-phosphate acyltransferase n=1 Tax=Phenylobacterium sp. TaxID=1871053 RepID=UPI002F402BEE